MQNSSFSMQSPAMQLAWDSVSRGAALRCWRYYEYAIVRGKQERRVDGFPPESEVHLTFGIWLHSAREIYYHERSYGHEHEQALDAALDYVLKATWNRTLGRPWVSDEPTKTRKTLIRTVVWYLDHWRDDPLETIILANGKPAVELSFQFDSGLRSSRGEPIVLAGHIDRLALFQGKPIVSDLKSTKSELGKFYFDTFSPDDQLTGYIFAANVAYSLPVRSLIIDAVQVGVTFSRFARHPIQRTEAQLGEWFDQFEDLVRQAEYYAERQRWPQNPKSCFRCQFREICARPPGAREEFIASTFNTRVWDPLQSRGDI